MTESRAFQAYETPLCPACGGVLLEESYDRMLRARPQPEPPFVLGKPRMGGLIATYTCDGPAAVPEPMRTYISHLGSRCTCAAAPE